MKVTLTIDVPEDGALPYLEERIQDAVRTGMDRQGFAMHNTTIERIASIVFGTLIFEASNIATILFDADDDVMTIEDFQDCIRSGMFTDYDGTGYYATHLGYTREVVDFRGILQGDWPVWATHVAWFNK